MTEFFPMKQVATLLILFFCSVCAMAKLPVYIVAGQSNTDGRASIDEMPDEIRRYVPTAALKTS